MKTILVSAAALFGLALFVILCCAGAIDASPLANTLVWVSTWYIIGCAWAYVLVNFLSQVSTRNNKKK
jgi:hypothetical protein